MSKDFVDSLRAEIASLEAEIERDERVHRLGELKKVLGLYQQANTPTVPAPGAQVVSHGLRRGRISPQREQLLKVARLYVANRVGPVPTREILAQLDERQISVGGLNAVNSLSAILSTSGQFDSHGRTGWTLKAGATSDAEIVADRPLPTLAEMTGEE